MSAVLADTSLHPVLERARHEARAAALPYAGGVPPLDAWALVQAGAAVLVDVRSAEERTFVGRVPGAAHVAWASGTSLTRNPRFVRELEARVRKDEPVLLLCLLVVGVLVLAYLVHRLVERPVARYLRNGLRSSFARIRAADLTDPPVRRRSGD